MKSNIEKLACRLGTAQSTYAPPLNFGRITIHSEEKATTCQSCDNLVASHRTSLCVIPSPVLRRTTSRQIKACPIVEFG
jgi:hypothetical protein